MITKIEDYFNKGCGRCPRFETPDCSALRWAAGLADLRRICLVAGLVESVKWGHPCYAWGDQNIALIGAYRENFILDFSNPSLLTDPEGILVKSGPNSAHPSLIRFSEPIQPIAMEGTIAAYLQEAIGYAQAGVRPTKAVYEIELQPELVDALDCDPEFSEAFNALTPGRQRSYVIHLSGTANPATRAARISKFRAKVLVGKGCNER